MPALKRLAYTTFICTAFARTSKLAAAANSTLSQALRFLALVVPLVNDDAFEPNFAVRTTIVVSAFKR